MHIYLELFLLISHTKSSTPKCAIVSKFSLLFTRLLILNVNSNPQTLLKINESPSISNFSLFICPGVGVFFATFKHANNIAYFQNLL